MANLYHKSSSESFPRTDPEKLLSTINEFLHSCHTPAVLEEGGEIIRLCTGEYSVEIRSGRLWIEAWPETYSLSRRILEISHRKPGLLDCLVYRFGGETGRLSFLDLNRQQTTYRTTSGKRQSFSEKFRRMLFRQFPGWKLARLSCGMDLQRSFSPVFPRAELTKGNQIIAALACPTQSEEGNLLTYALLWFHYLRSHATPKAQVSLALFMPDGTGILTAHRLKWLKTQVLRPCIFRFNEHGSAGEVDPQDLGNLHTAIQSSYAPSRIENDLRLLLSRLEALPHVSYCHEINGSISIRFRGLEFARRANGRLFLGTNEQHEIDLRQGDKVVEYAQHLCDLSGSLPTLPEKWLEMEVRSHLSCIDAKLCCEPIHSQILTFAAGDRHVIDLLTVSLEGVLTVLELKASEDIQLPIQALDYWMRVHWHAERNEIQPLFPGVRLASSNPKLILLAPAISFHSSIATVLSYFSPQIDVERIGVNSHWHEQFRVVLRLQGDAIPISHGGFHANSWLDEYS